MYGDLGNKLVQDAKRSRNLKKSIQNNKNISDEAAKYGLNDYAKDLIDNIIDETSELGLKATRMSEKFDEVSYDSSMNSNLRDKINKCEFFTTILTINRNKRCLLGYENFRRENIEEFVWDNLTHLDNYNEKEKNPQDQCLQSVVDKLDMNEVEYLKEYKNVIDDYVMKFPELEIKHKGSYGLLPPKDLHIEVRVIRDGGMVQTEYGVFNLIKDSQIFMRHSDAEQLLQEGYLQIIKH